MPDINPRDLVELLRPIVEIEMPDEKLAFSLSANDIALSISEHSEKNISTKNPAHFDFLSANAASDVLEFVKLISATFTFLTSVAVWIQQRHPSHPSNSELQETWRAELVKAGLPEMKASRISKNFINEITSNRKGAQSGN